MTEAEHPDVTYSVIVPAYNEEDFLAETLEKLTEAMADIDTPGEVIVVDNNSTDATAEIARQHGARVVFEPINQISRARNVGANAACGDYFIFLDADTLLSGSLLAAALGNLGGGECCGGGAVIEMGAELTWPSRYFMGFWNWMALHVGIAAGAFIYCLRKAYFDIGGFSEKVYASEEIWFSGRLRRWGKKNALSFKVITEHSAVTSARKLQWFGTGKMLLMMFLMMLCPFLVRSRKMCWMWYTRPKKQSSEPADDD